MRTFGQKLAPSGLGLAPSVVWMLALSTILSAAPLAAQSTAESSAYGERVSVSLDPILGGEVVVESGPLPTVAGSAPPAYSLAQTLPSFSVSVLGLGELVGSDTLSVSASSPVPVGRVAVADALVEGLGIAVLDLLGIGADEVSSRIVVEPAAEDCNAGLDITADSNIVGGSIGGLLFPEGIAIPSNPEPNTELLDLLGVRVILNEQVVGPASVSVNAMHVFLDLDVLLVGELTAEIVIAHTEGSVDCVDPIPPPDPTADLALTVVDTPDPVEVDGLLTTTWTVTNNGPAAAEDVILGVSLPSGSDLVGVPSECVQVASGLMCDLGDLPNATSAEVAHQTVPTLVGTMVYSAMVSSNIDDPNPDDNEVTELTQVLFQDPGGGGEPPADDDAAALCKAGVVPAATLLVPYFEVDIADPAGRTTLVSVNNTTSEPVLAQVTLWTDWAVPTLAFPIYLTGYDVQSLNLRDVFVSGVLPATGPSASPHGQQSTPALAFPGCPGQVTDSLTVADREDLQALHAGQASPRNGMCAASARADTMLATGYVTIDVVDRCSSSTPADSGYFGGADPVARKHNALWGDVYFVDPGGNFAQGEPAVHLEADPDRFVGRTFYRRYSGGTDNRQPLSSVYGTRYLTGGAFSGGTELVVWRDTGSPAAEPRACDDLPEWAPLRRQAGLAFDEEENGVALPATSDATPWATQRVVVGEDLPVPDEFGWLRLDLARSPQPGIAGGQSWVTTVIGAESRYSLAYPAVQLDDACQP